MGGKIPRPTRLQVIRAWFEGNSRDKIAEELQISTGAVSGIINDLRKKDPQFDLLREVAVKTKKQGMDIESFAPLVRLYEVLREKELLTGITGHESLELMQDRLEAIIVDLEMFCFKKEQLSIQDFVSLVTNMYSTADKLGIPLYTFPAYITELKDMIAALRKEIDQIEAKKRDALRDCGMTLELLDEYNGNKPFLERIRKLEGQLADANEKICEREQDLKKEKFWNEFEEAHMWSISENELNEASTALGLSRIDNFYGNPSLRAGDLKEMAMDVFYHPSRYVKMLRQMRDIYNSHHKTTIASTN
ncbi:MAG TPA: helix-turn-helix domain-containing protein [Nitrososphaeraceae archaeon]|nr:helix-turn-helix domain-containing protein [Nitrososphaeraceae archaeon]